MKAYLFDSDVTNFDWLYCVDKKDLRHLGEIEWGDRLEDIWRSIPVEVSLEKGEKPKGLGDFPNFIPGVIVVSEKAHNLLKPYIDEYVEFLELDVLNEDKYYLMNIINIIDCLDHEKSKINYFRSSGRIMDVKKYVFTEMSIPKYSCFRVKGHRVDNFISESLGELIRQSDLKGYELDNPGRVKSISDLF